MEAEAGETEPATGEQLIEAADVLRGVHDFDLSQTYLQRARAVGASDTAVRIGMANNYMAVGDTVRAQGELAGSAAMPIAIQTIGIWWQRPMSSGNCTTIRRR